ncbi:MAG: proteasome endopeptidase complex subunit beta [Promethearchaeota archaeon CR_4]|nr:MAG: proteasome endopeptidase complex subunit beta [Candidatus Lokiarchaeota archaeon CR_4]
MKTIDENLKVLLDNHPDFKIVDLNEQNLSQQQKLPHLKTGTTTCGLKVAGGVVLAADKRATMGNFIANRQAQKVNRLLDHIWMTIAGGVADAQYLIDIMRAEAQLFEMKRKRKIPVKALSHMLANMLFRNKQSPYEVGLIMGGYTDDEGPALFDLDALGSILPEDFTSVGSGSPFCIGVLETNWKPNLTPEAGKALAVKAIQAAIARDINTGNGVDVVVITNAGYEFDHIPVK